MPKLSIPENLYSMRSEVTPEVIEHWDEIFNPYEIPSSPWPKRCPRVKGKMLIVKGYPLGNEYGGDILYRGIVFNITCNRWDCKPCAQRKVGLLIRRAAVGSLVRETDRLIKLGYKYPVKMFHLTLPGKGWREKTNPLEALQKIRKAQNNLMRALTKLYGKFHYLCTVEPDKNGWPHIHMLIVSESIAASKPLHRVKHIWCDLQKMGFVFVTVKIKEWDKKIGGYREALVKDARQGIRYATKYMWKGLQNFGDYKKLISTSRGVLGNASDLVDDYGFPVFMQLNRENEEDLHLDQHNRRTDTYELFATKDVAELESIRDMLGDGVFACRVKGEFRNELKEEFPNALLPKVYVRKCPDCGFSMRHCVCGNCVRCGLPRAGSELIEGCQCVGQ